MTHPAFCHAGPDPASFPKTTPLPNQQDLDFLPDQFDLPFTLPVLVAFPGYCIINIIVIFVVNKKMTFIF
jgi:hypothetical protein